MTDYTRRRRFAGSQGGFSLLEVMVALMVLMIGLSATILVFAQGASLQARSKRYMDSARLAQSIASELQFLAKEYNKLPVDQQGNKQITIDSHAGFSDQYKVNVAFGRLNLSDQSDGNLSYQQTAYGVQITVLFQYEGEQLTDEYYTAVVVSEN